MTKVVITPVILGCTCLEGFYHRGWAVLNMFSGTSDGLFIPFEHRTRKEDVDIVTLPQ